MGDVVEILVYGSAIVDFSCYVEKLPKVGQTLHGSKFIMGYGGKGANQCVAAGRLGARTALIAKLGDDYWGNEYIKHLRSENICIDYVDQCKWEPTGVAQIAVSNDGQNHIIIVPGANKQLNRNDVMAAKNLFQNAKVLLCQLETPIEGTIEAIQSFNGISILNAAPAMEDLHPDLLTAASIICVNETEAALMAKCCDITSLEKAKNAIKQILQNGANSVILTLGALGAIYMTAKDSLCMHIPAHDVSDVVDTTGAGDAFIGALAYHLCKHPDKKMHEHIAFACYAAAHSVQHSGTQASFPYLKDVQPNADDIKFNYI